MPHVSVHYKIYLTAGHHRQPRNASAILEPEPPSEVDVDNPGNITPLYLPQLPYTWNSSPALAQLLFWSVTDGASGQTYPPDPLTQPVGSNPLTITAWYFPIGDGTGPMEIIDDAFSAVKGDFIDDTFVTVTSDASLTNQANVVGVVPTAKAETLMASSSVVSTPEPFSQWISYDAGTPSGDKINVPAGASGIAIAVYEQPRGLDPTRKYEGEAIFGTVIGGVAVDGGGAIVINGVPHPVDPWGPPVMKLVKASLTVAGSRGMDPEISERVQQLAAQGVLDAIRQALPDIEKAAGGR